MRLYGRKLLNCISFDGQLNVEFNAVKIKNILQIDIAEKHHCFSLFLSYLMNMLRFEPAICMYFCKLVLINSSCPSSCPHSVSCFNIIINFCFQIDLNIKDLQVLKT